MQHRTCECGNVAPQDLKHPKENHRLYDALSEAIYISRLVLVRAGVCSSDDA